MISSIVISPTAEKAQTGLAKNHPKCRVEGGKAQPFEDQIFVSLSSKGLTSKDSQPFDFHISSESLESYLLRVNHRAR